MMKNVSIFNVIKLKNMYVLGVEYTKIYLQ
jgi:hypothetical protein